MINRKQELYHYGIPRQKKGVRRFQYYDGSLTPEGRERYGVGEGRKSNKQSTTSKKKPSRSNVWYVNKYQDRNGKLTKEGEERLKKGDNVVGKKYHNAITELRNLDKRSDESRTKLINKPYARSNEKKNYYRSRSKVLNALSIINKEFANTPVDRLSKEDAELGYTIAQKYIKELSGTNSKLFKNAKWVDDYNLGSSVLSEDYYKNKSK